MNRYTTNTNSMYRPTTAYNDAKAWWRQQYRSCRDAGGHTTSRSQCRHQRPQRPRRGGQREANLLIRGFDPRPITPLVSNSARGDQDRSSSLPQPPRRLSPGGVYLTRGDTGANARRICGTSFIYLFFALLWRVPAASASPGRVLLQAHHSLAVSRGTSRRCGAVIFWLDCISTRLFFTEYCERCIVKRVYLCSLFVFILSLFIHFSRLNDYTLIDKIIFISIPALKT